MVVLDGHTMNPGDLSWDALQSLAQCYIYDRTVQEKVVDRAREAEAVITNKVVLDRSLIEELPELKYVGVSATGYNVIDPEAARERGIVVTNVPGYSTESVAQMVFALLLELCHRVGRHAWTVREGRWAGSLDFCYWDFPLVELNGLTMGIVGLGRIGQAVARLAGAFGMRVLAYRRPRQLAEAAEVEFVDLDTLFARSDVISLNCPLTDETERLVNRRRLSQMKETAFLINTSRGPVVDEEALADALNSGRIAGAGMDVLAVEPPSADNPLLSAPNCFITPHIAWATRAARERLMDTVVGNFRAFLEGRRQNVVI